MFTERRRSPRRSINRVAQFHSESCPTPRPILLTDLSERGARLFTEIELPPTFTLAVSGDGVNERRNCRVVWQLGGEIGVEFINARRI